MYSWPSMSQIAAPEPLFMKTGVPPTALNARTDEFTPPGITFLARANAEIDRSKFTPSPGGSGRSDGGVDVGKASLLRTEPAALASARASACIERSSPCKHSQPSRSKRGAFVKRGKRFEAPVVLRNDGFVAVPPALATASRRAARSTSGASPATAKMRCARVSTALPKAGRRAAHGRASDRRRSDNPAAHRAGPENVSRPAIITGATSRSDDRRVPAAARRQSVASSLPGKRVARPPAKITIARLACGA